MTVPSTSDELHPKDEADMGLAVAVAIGHDDRLLLIRRSADSSHCPGQWEWPGGKVDAGEHFAVAARREVHEETGLHVELTGVVGAMGFSVRGRQVAWLCLEGRLPHTTDPSVALSSEHDASAWVTLKELKALPLRSDVADFMRAYNPAIDSGTVRSLH